ncbi:MAG: acetyl-CoA acetyltransferase [Candidatus Heimdallarchaeota archaeon]
MRDITIIGVGMGHRWGNHPKKSIIDLMARASLEAIEDAGTDRIDGLLVANMGAGRMNNQTALGSALIDYLNLYPAIGATVENGAASGATAIRMAALAIKSGHHDCIIVAGGEKMRGASSKEITNLIATMAHPEAEYNQGITFPSLGAFLTRLYFEKFGVSREDLARIAVKSHANGLKNPFAHLHKKITVPELLTDEKLNPLIVDPLHRYDICPISDGAASVIVCEKALAKKITDGPLIQLTGIGHGMDTMTVHERLDPTFLGAVKRSCDLALLQAKKSREDISLIELHDAFTILELAEAESAGFFEPGTAHLAVKDGKTEITGDLPINPSGGLKSRGHPLGATGVAQICELVWQLRGEAGARQVPNNPVNGLAINFGGFGNSVVSTIVSRV